MPRSPLHATAHTYATVAISGELATTVDQKQYEDEDGPCLPSSKQNTPAPGYRLTCRRGRRTVGDASPAALAAAGETEWTCHPGMVAAGLGTSLADRNSMP